MNIPANHPDVMRMLRDGSAVDTTPRKRADRGAGAGIAGVEAGGVPAANGNDSAPVVVVPPVPSVPVRVIVGPIPVRLASEANSRGKLREKISRKQAVKTAVRAALVGVSPPPLPVVVRIIRVGGKRLDDDNLARACKAVRDMVAEHMGIDDADRRVRWVVAQKPGYSAGVVIDVRSERC